MASATNNLKYNFGADTSGFDRGAKKVKQGLRDLDKTTGDLKSSLGAAFGIDTRKLEQLSSAAQGLGTRFAKLGKEGNAAMQAITSGAGKAIGAVGGIAIAGLIAGFKSLKDEADAYKETLEGANYALANTVYLDTYRQALQEIGGQQEKVGQFWSDMGTKVKSLGATLKSELATTVYNFIEGGVDWNQRYAQDIPAAKAKAETAKAAQQAINALQIEQMRNGPRLVAIQADMAAELNKIRDTSLTITERQEALARYEALVTEQYTLQHGVLKQMYEQTVLRNAQAENSREVEAAQYAMEAQLVGLEKQREESLGRIFRYRNSIANAAAKEAEAIAKSAEIEASRASLADFASAGRALLADNNLNNLTGATTQLGEMTIKVHPIVDEEEILDLGKHMTSLLSSSLAEVGTLMGDLVGDLATGGDAWNNFANSAVSAMGDMAIAVGKIAIETGVAALGIDQALNFGGPYAAIAAGVALVALGSAVKTSMSNIAAGNTGAASTSVASSAYSYNDSTGYDVETMKVEIIGTLKAQGSELVAVIDTENKRKSHTT